MEKKNLHEQLQKNILNKHQQAAAKGGYRVNPTASHAVSVRWDDVVFRATSNAPDTRFNSPSGDTGRLDSNNMFIRGKAV